MHPNGIALVMKAKELALEATMTLEQVTTISGRCDEDEMSSRDERSPDDGGDPDGGTTEQDCGEACRMRGLGAALLKQKPMTPSYRERRVEMAPEILLRPVHSL
jgi:hypothetical protein